MYIYNILLYIYIQKGNAENSQKKVLLLNVLNKKNKLLQFVPIPVGLGKKISNNVGYKLCPERQC